MKKTGYCTCTSTKIVFRAFLISTLNKETIVHIRNFSLTILCWWLQLRQSSEEGDILIHYL